MRKQKQRQIQLIDVPNLIVISDTHCGCKMGICPPSGAALDDGGHYTPSEFQLKMWAYWEKFWSEWVPTVCRGEPFVLVFNGDAIDGVHHNSTTQISYNLTDQMRIAEEVLRPVVEKSVAYYHIRGTEAHVRASGQDDENHATPHDPIGLVFRSRL